MAAWRAALAPVVVAAVAVGAGLLAFAVVRAAWQATADDADGWADLAGAVVGVAAGVVVAVVCYVAGLAVAVRRVRAPGERLGPFAVGVLAPAVWGAVAFVVSSRLPRVPGPDALGASAVTALALLALAGVMVAFAWPWVAVDRRRALRVLGLTTVAVAAGCVTVAVAWAEAAERRAVAGLPLVLFGGDDEAPVAGWQRDVLSVTSVTTGRDVADDGHQAWLKYVTPDGVAFLTMYSALRPCESRDGWGCRRLGAMPDGELRRYTAPDGDVHTALAYPDGSGVAVWSTAPVDAVAVLDALERVDRRTFEREAGPLRMG